MKRLLEWLLSFFKSSGKQGVLEKKVEDAEKKLEEIENEKTDIDDVIDRLNK